MLNLNTAIETITSSQKTLFIMCGFPYAGKSYIAAELQKHTDVVYVSIDTIFHTHGFDWDTNTLPGKEDWQKIFDESYEVTKEALLKNKNVLYDSTNQTIVSRDTLRRLAESVDAETRVLYVQTSVETVWKRWSENQENPTRSVVSKELVQMTIDTFEIPTNDEKVIIVVNE